MSSDVHRQLVAVSDGLWTSTPKAEFFKVVPEL